MLARISLYIVNVSLIAGHFLRVGNFIGVAFCVATPFLFFVRQHWSLLLLQALAHVAAAVWLVTAWQIAAERFSLGSRGCAPPSFWLPLPPLVRWLAACCAAGACNRAMANGEVPAPAGARRSYA